MQERPKILLIDDDRDIRDALRLILEPEEYELTCCSTGPAGLEAMRRSRPDLLLLDIMLSTPSEGFHLAYQMQKDELLREVPIVMISAIGQRTGINYARELGSDYMPARAFLEKPLDARTVRETVRQTLAARPRAHAAPPEGT